MAEETNNQAVYFGINLWNECARATARCEILGHDAYIKGLLTDPLEKYNIPDILEKYMIAERKDLSIPDKNLQIKEEH